MKTELYWSARSISFMKCFGVVNHTVQEGEASEK